MTSPEEVLREAVRLADEGRPYALATVTSVVPPASTRRGDRALVTAEGEVRGWIGGACSEPTVIREALRALADREPRVVRIEGGCASEGVVEVLVEPCLPSPLLAVVGESPAAATLARLATTIGWRVSTEPVQNADAVVVASMGGGDEDTLEAALTGRAGYVGLVASARRAATVVEALRARGLDEAALARLRSPAGLDLGPSSQQEIAVAILAELVAWRHLGTADERPLAEAVDPVCGMTVALGDATETTEHEAVVYAFCGAHCRSVFEADPVQFVMSERRSH